MIRKYSSIVADDEPEFCEIMKGYLEGFGVFKSIIICSNGVDAKFKIMNQDFDFIMLDLDMPKLDGVGLIEDLIKMKKANPQKIVVCSGNVSGDRIKSILGLGVKNILTKPLKVEVLKEKVFKLLEIE